MAERTIGLAHSPEQEIRDGRKRFEAAPERLSCEVGWLEKPNQPGWGFCLTDRLGKFAPVPPGSRMLDPSADFPDETPLVTVRLPTRIFNALSNAGLRTLGEIRESSDKTLLSFQDLGRGSLRWLRERL